MILKLGHADKAAVQAMPDQIVTPYHDWSGRPRSFRGEPNNSWFPVKPRDESPVAGLQRQLRRIGVHPRGRIDGIFGYRTQSATRLFQEYVRTIDGDLSVGTADGVAGPKTLAKVHEWVNAGRVADWSPADDSHARIFEGLARLRDSFLGRPPDPAMQVLEAHASGTASRAVADWTFDPSDLHLLGIRRDDTSVVLRNGKFVRRNDDIFVLLVKGCRFVFRGSTDPSPNMANRSDAAFLIRGQHEYRFGWHKISTVGSSKVRVYRAFKPKNSRGVLVVRATDGQLTPASYDGGAKPNATINIHWSGSGTSNWSAGCQVIAGKKYKNMRNEIIDLSDTASAGYADLGHRTRGAYNLLLDLATVHADDIRCLSSDTLLYTLLYEQDLAAVPGSAGIDFRTLVSDLS